MSLPRGPYYDEQGRMVIDESGIALRAISRGELLYLRIGGNGEGKKNPDRAQYLKERGIEVTSA